MRDGEKIFLVWPKSKALRRQDKEQKNKKTSFNSQPETKNHISSKVQIPKQEVATQNKKGKAQIG